MLRSGYTEGFGDGLLRSSMDAGPAKVRRRSSFTPSLLTGTFRMTRDQLFAATAFIRGPLIGGSLPFYIPDPMRGPEQSALVRFVTLPKWTEVAKDVIDFDVDLEVLAVVAS